MSNTTSTPATHPSIDQIMDAQGAWVNENGQMVSYVMPEDEVYHAVRITTGETQDFDDFFAAASWIAS